MTFFVKNLQKKTKFFGFEIFLHEWLDELRNYAQKFAEFY